MRRTRLATYRGGVLLDGRRDPRPGIRDLQSFRVIRGSSRDSHVAEHEDGDSDGVIVSKTMKAVFSPAVGAVSGDNQAEMLMLDMECGGAPNTSIGRHDLHIAAANSCDDARRVYGGPGWVHGGPPG